MASVPMESENIDKEDFVNNDDVKTDLKNIKEIKKKPVPLPSMDELEDISKCRKSKKNFQ
jgi:hypothetical protein